MDKLIEIFRMAIEYIVKFLLQLYNSPIAQKMTSKVFDIAAKEFTHVAEFIAREVEEVAGLPITQREKFEVVWRNTSREFEGVPGRVINSLIEAAWLVIREEMEKRVDA